VIARCPAQGIVLRSDSLEHYGDEGRLFFIGHVDYSEPRLKLKSDQLTYFQRDERLLATQNVNARLPSGSTLKGPQLEFFRAVPNVRPRQSATAIGRPTIALVEKDAQGREQPPVNVTGNTVYLLGDSIVSAQGSVVVVRPSLTATGDSLYVDSGTGLLRIMRTPKIVGTKGRPFTLVGETIDLLSKGRKLDRVLAKSAAEATSEDLNLKSDTIDFRVTDDLLQRAVAWGKGRARATSPTQTIVSDSIDVLMPAQRVREMHALRGASAEGMPDTTKFRTTEKDRLTGDTIVASFDTIPARDTSSKPRIRELVATGHATSLQHLPPRDTSSCVRLPAINYVRGRVITVDFDSAKVKTVVVTDSLAGGMYLEPNADTTCARLAKRPPAAATAGTVGATPPASSTTPPGQQPPPPPTRTPVVPAPAVVTPSKRP
jgi:lipopolysaccharide export system protein LptA